MAGPRIPDLSGLVSTELLPVLQPIKDALEIYAGQRANASTDRLVTAAEANRLAEFAYLHVIDEKTANTSGGTFTAGAWQTRTLNTVNMQRGITASLNNNQLLLDAGLYMCRIQCPAYRVDRHKARLRNMTDVVDLLYGSSSYSSNVGAYALSTSVIVGWIDLQSSKILEVQHRGQTSFATQGFGLESNFGVPEIYTVAEFWKQRSI
jgi:hypothetical protein